MSSCNLTLTLVWPNRCTGVVLPHIRVAIPPLHPVLQFCCSPHDLNINSLCCLLHCGCSFVDRDSFDGAALFAVTAESLLGRELYEAELESLSL